MIEHYQDMKAFSVSVLVAFAFLVLWALGWVGCAWIRAEYEWRSNPTQDS